VNIRSRCLNLGIHSRAFLYQGTNSQKSQKSHDSGFATQIDYPSPQAGLYDLFRFLDRPILSWAAAHTHMHYIVTCIRICCMYVCMGSLIVMFECVSPTSVTHSSSSWLPAPPGTPPPLLLSLPLARAVVPLPLLAAACSPPWWAT
jgi:hypothetical protein